VSGRVLYDHREEASGLPELLAFEGLELEAAALELGDYIVSERIGIERKAAADFVASLKDGRLFEQAERLVSAYEIPILLLEGEPHFPRAAVVGAIGGLLRRRLQVLRVGGIEESAEMITRLAHQEARGSSGPRRVKLARRRRGPDEMAEDVLASLPGISLTRAKALLDRFGNLQAVACAEEKDLREVAGIGRKSAATLRQIFAHEHGSEPWAERDDG
jgi:ERCC4-type nuclease